MLSIFSEIGGFLGLLLGASVLTVCEIFDFIIITIGSYCEERKRKKGNKTNTTSKRGEQKVNTATRNKNIFFDNV